MIVKAGHATRVNKVFPGTSLRPDIIITSILPIIITDLTITFDAPDPFKLDSIEKWPNTIAWVPSYPLFWGPRFLDAIQQHCGIHTWHPAQLPRRGVVSGGRAS
ncbi:Uncharacterized protein APZ42_034540 [Daphnia magna]|uniref:Uncharacterized protein n=1 Tax=Daphnia magna TaxID=35525 RepID=A0A164K1Y6_9CRUS|nr:Uncharacterized protein APZ42_034540 [Daphnia magna]